MSTFCLWLFTILVFGRVVGQLVVARFAPRWLPPFDQWQSGLLPYPALLAGQAVVLSLMVWISIDFSRKTGFWVEPRPWLGLAAIVWSYFYFAAMIFQHGQSLEDYARARDLATRAADLGRDRARWLAAAAHDRWLVHQGKPQRYGTQYRASNGRWVLDEVDESTTDEERATMGVPSIAEARARAEALTRTSPPPATS